MERLEGFRCADCGELASPPDATRCPECGGILDAEYDAANLEIRPVDNVDGPWPYDPLLPFRPDGMGEGNTPLVSAPKLAEELDVDGLFIKDESANPTGSVVDRGMAMVAQAAARTTADVLSLATTGNGGQSAAAYAARMGLASQTFVPSRATFVTKAMINVHGGDMQVVEGRYDDARSSYEAALEDRPEDSDEEPRWFPAGPFDSPYRHEGLKSVYAEIVSDLGAVPDAIVTPAGHGTLPTALWKAAREFESVGVVDNVPRISIAQPAGCAPIVDAVRAGSDPEPWDVPDTVVGSLEIPDPAGGRPAVEAVRSSGGAAVAVTDDDLLDSAVTLAQHGGLTPSVAAGTAAAAAWQLRDAGDLSSGDRVVILNPETGNKDADIIRSRLMSRGI